MEKHGMSHTKIYKRWEQMKNRCKYSSNENYNHYGGRGISVCREWQDSFLTYYNYIMSLPDAEKGLSLDRIENDGNYEPGNVMR